MIFLDKAVLKKYKILIQDVEDYILKKNDRRKANRKVWTSEEREKWKLRCPECPLCHESYDESNPISKEHITPLFLGGPERDCNIIALCDKCNKSRDKVMKKLLATTDIAHIRERWPAIKPAVDYFVIWCHITLYDYDNLYQVKDLNDAFSIERQIHFPLTSKRRNNIKFLERIKVFLNFSRRKDVVLNHNLQTDMEEKAISKVVKPKVEAKVEKEKIEIKKVQKNEIKEIVIKKPNVIFNLIDWIIKNWKDKSDYSALRSDISEHEMKNGGNRKLRVILKQDFEIPYAWGLDKISLYFIELKDKVIDSNNRIDRAAALIEQSRNRLLVKEKESITIPSSEDFKIILAKSITKRVGANTYKDGFKISQITYIFKQNKDEYNLSWNKFFNHLGVRYQENVATTSEKLLQELDLIIEPSINKDGEQIYVIKV